MWPVRKYKLLHPSQREIYRSNVLTDHYQNFKTEIIHCNAPISTCLWMNYSWNCKLRNSSWKTKGITECTTTDSCHVFLEVRNETSFLSLKNWTFPWKSIFSKKIISLFICPECIILIWKQIDCTGIQRNESSHTHSWHDTLLSVCHTALNTLLHTTEHFSNNQ